MDDRPAKKWIALKSAPKPTPDAAIEAARDEDRPARARRQKTHPCVAASVVALRKCEHVVDHQAHRFGVGSPLDQLLGRDPKRRQALRGKIHSTGFRILENIA